MVSRHQHTVSTRGQGDAHDLTGSTATAVRASGIRHGLATVFVVGSTAAITTIEFEPGAIADLNGLLERLAPRHAAYRHHERWGDDNGSSHVRASLIGPSVTIPVVDGQLALGTWQQILLLECDTRGREREVIVQIAGEQDERPPEGDAADPGSRSARPERQPPSTEPPGPHTDPPSPPAPSPSPQRPIGRPRPRAG